MKNEYQKMMGQVGLSDSARTDILERLEHKRPVRRMVRPLRVAVIAACVCLVLVGGAMAAGVVFGQIQLGTGGLFAHLNGEDGYTKNTYIAPEEDPVQLRDGVFYLIVNGVEVDITGKFSETEPFIYTVDRGEKGYSHIVVGGSRDGYGYMEIVYDISGNNLGSSGGGSPGYSSLGSEWAKAYWASLKK